MKLLFAIPIFALCLFGCGNTTSDRDDVLPAETEFQFPKVHYKDPSGYYNKAHFAWTKEESTALLHKSVKEGNALAMHSLAFEYTYVDFNETSATFWLNKAIERAEQKQDYELIESCLRMLSDLHKKSAKD